MAQSSRSLTQRMEEELTCAVCCELFTNPLLLHCSHTFCKKCIKDLVRNNDEVSRYGALSSSFKCPVCRRFISLKSIRGIDDLPENLSLANLVALLKNDTGGSPRLSRQQVPTLESSACKEHKGSVVSLFCLDCSKSLCPSCSVRCHGHRLKPVDILWKDKWKNILALMNESGEKMSAINERVQLLDDQLKGIDDQESSAKIELKAEVEILKSMLLSRLAQLNAEVHSEVHGLCHPVIQEREMCTNLLASLESTNTCIQDLQRSQDGVKSVKTLVQLEGVLSNLLKNNVPKLLNRTIPVVTMPTWKLLRDNTETSIRTLIVRRTGPFPSESVARVGVSDTSCPMRTSPDEPDRRDVLSTDVSMTSSITSNRGSYRSGTGQRNPSLNSGGEESAMNRLFPSQTTARHKAKPVRSLSTAKKTEEKIHRGTVADRLFTAPLTSNGQASSVSILTDRATAVSSSTEAAASSLVSGDENMSTTLQNTVNDRVDSILNKLKKLEVCAENWDVHSTKKVKTREENKSGFKDFGTTVPSSFTFGDCPGGAAGGTAGGPELFSGATPFTGVAPGQSSGPRATTVLKANPQSSFTQDKGGLFKFGQATSRSSFTSPAASEPAVWGGNLFGTSNMNSPNTASGFGGLVGTRPLASRRIRQTSKKGSVSQSNPGNKGFNFKVDLSSGGNSFSFVPPSGGALFEPSPLASGGAGLDAGSRVTDMFTAWKPRNQQDLGFRGFGVQTASVASANTNTGFLFTPPDFVSYNTGTTNNERSAASGVNTANTIRKTTVKTAPQPFLPGLKSKSFDFKVNVTSPGVVTSVTKLISSCSESSTQTPTADILQLKPNTGTASEHFNFQSLTPVLTQRQMDTQCQSEEKPEYIQHVQASSEAQTVLPVTEPAQSARENCEPPRGVEQHVGEIIVEAANVDLKITTTQSHDHSYARADVEQSAEVSLFPNDGVSGCSAIPKAAPQDSVESRPNSKPDSNSKPTVEQSHVNSDDKSHVPDSDTWNLSSGLTSDITVTELEKAGSNSSINLAAEKESSGTGVVNETAYSRNEQTDVVSDLNVKADTEARQSPSAPNMSAVSDESDELTFLDARSDPETSPQKLSSGSENTRPDSASLLSEEDCSEENKTVKTFSQTSNLITDENLFGYGPSYSVKYQPSDVIPHAVLTTSNRQELSYVTEEGSVQVTQSQDFTLTSTADGQVIHSSMPDANFPQVLSSDKVSSSWTDEGHQSTNTVQHKNDRYSLITDLAAALSAGSLGTKSNGSMGSAQGVQPNNVHTSVTVTGSTSNSAIQATEGKMYVLRSQFISADTTQSIATPIMSLTSMTSQNHSACATTSAIPTACDIIPISADSTLRENTPKNSTNGNAMSDFSFGQFSSAFLTPSNSFGKFSTERPFSFGQSTTFLGNPGNSSSVAGQQSDIASGWSNTQTAANSNTSFSLGGKERPSAPSKITFGFQFPSANTGSAFQFGSSTGTVFGQPSQSLSVSASGSVKDDDDSAELPDIKPFQFEWITK